MTYIFHTLKFLLKKCSAFFLFSPRVQEVKYFLDTDLKAVVSWQKLRLGSKKCHSESTFHSNNPFSKYKLLFSILNLK